MPLITKPYREQAGAWPASGRHIMAQYDEDSIVVYQAYTPSIARYAAARGRLGGGFKRDRMTWIKPNFLWMMYRCGWATKERQERVLAIRLTREGFEEILAHAVHSAYVEGVYENEEQWRTASRDSDVVMQWDPDHGPMGEKLERRAVQLGLRGDTLARYVDDWVVGIEDITDFVHEQSGNAVAERRDRLMTPWERVYDVRADDVRKRVL
ncbi:hypothetical protein CCAX7_20270 [Capsulimonas corticalis]|uniref:Uncharacterized protein n=1 Tax=Capsulimonas corticalis TaxID=2219043 RepID=A0A402D2E4_9BACT|nr:DUF4291 domain-containing protein [Capsulimonas corticalis]BDI29976.1 hypothetical protein CCAX7_20270 [Capsulimonas corticalis]